MAINLGFTRICATLSCGWNCQLIDGGVLLITISDDNSLGYYYCDWQNRLSTHVCLVTCQLCPLTFRRCAAEPQPASTVFCGLIRTCKWVEESIPQTLLSEFGSVVCTLLCNPLSLRQTEIETETDTFLLLSRRSVPRFFFFFSKDLFFASPFFISFCLFSSLSISTSSFLCPHYKLGRGRETASSSFLCQAMSAPGALDETAAAAVAVSALFFLLLPGDRCQEIEHYHHHHHWAEGQTVCACVCQWCLMAPPSPLDTTRAINFRRLFSFYLFLLFPFNPPLLHSSRCLCCALMASFYLLVLLGAPLSIFHFSLSAFPTARLIIVGIIISPSKLSACSTDVIGAGIGCVHLTTVAAAAADHMVIDCSVGQLTSSSSSSLHISSN